MPQLVDSGLFNIIGTDGALGVGWKIHTYVSGSSTDLASYPTEADANALTNAHSNPIIIGASGRPPQIWINAACKVVLLDASDVVKETLDPVTDDSAASTISYATAAEVMAGTSSTKVIAPSTLAGATAIAALTDGASIPWNMAAYVNPKVTITASRTLATPTNPIQGRTYVLRVIQGGSGSYTMTWPASFDWGSAGAPTLSTAVGASDLITVYCLDASTPKFAAAVAVQGLG